MWIIFKLRSEFNKIKDSLKDLTSQVLNNQDKIKEFVSEREINLMIENALLKNKEELLAQSPHSPQTEIRRKAVKLLDKAEILHEIASMDKQELSTGYMFNEIVNVKQLCKKSCFFKYLKIVRNQDLQTPKTNSIQSTDIKQNG